MAPSSLAHRNLDIIGKQQVLDLLGVRAEVTGPPVPDLRRDRLRPDPTRHHGAPATKLSDLPPG